MVRRSFRAGSIVSRTDPFAATTDSTTDSKSLDLRTGDDFWGFHLGAVIPCSSVVVKGGGHLVTFSPQGRGDLHSVFQVVGEKHVEL